MDKNQYLKKLDKCLKSYGVSNREEVVADYEEHFNVAIQKGESMEEICASLGSPEEVASQYTNKMASSLKKKPHKKFLVFTIIFGIIMLYFGICSFNLLLANGPDSNIFYLREQTVYYYNSEKLEITLRNVSLKKYEKLKLCISSTNKINGSSTLLDEFEVSINPLSGLTTQIKLDNYYYENCTISVVYQNKEDGINYSLMAEENYRPMKAVIITYSLLFVLGTAGFATFLPIYIIKRKAYNQG